jgi:hypothetical protein
MTVCAAVAAMQLRSCASIERVSPQRDVLQRYGRCSRVCHGRPAFTIGQESREAGVAASFVNEPRETSVCFGCFGRGYRRFPSTPRLGLGVRSSRLVRSDTGSARLRSAHIWRRTGRV